MSEKKARTGNSRTDTKAAPRASNNSHHVMLSIDGGWIVRRDGAERASKRFDSLKEAISWATEVARERRGELVVHHRDGTIQSKRSYGNAAVAAAVYAS